MVNRISLRIAGMFIATSALTIALVGQDDVASWKTFKNRAGWSIRYPSNWTVSSCRQCDDLTAPKSPLFIGSPSKVMIHIEPLAPKPPNASPDQWLHEMVLSTDGLIRKEWIVVNGVRMLRATYENEEGGRMDHYFLRSSETYGIGIPNEPLALKVLSTFRFPER